MVGGEGGEEKKGRGRGKEGKEESVVVGVRLEKRSKIFEVRPEGGRQGRTS